MIKVDDHGAVAHVGGLMVGLPRGGEGHPPSAGADRHSQGVARRLGGRSGVAHHQALPLQDDGLCVVLAPGARRGPQQEQEQERGHAEEPAQLHTVLGD